MAVVVVHDSGLDGDLGGVVALAAHHVADLLHGRGREAAAVVVAFGRAVHAQGSLDPGRKYLKPKI